MKNTVKTLFHNLARFKAATLLNVAGLTVAFAAFMIILTQVRYELTFDKVHPTSEQLYQMEFLLEAGSKYETYISRPLAEELMGLTPKILMGAYRDDTYSDMVAYDLAQGAATAIHEWVARASEHFPDVFGLKAVSGHFSGFDLDNKAIISQQSAARLFGAKDPVGEQLVLSEGVSRDTLEVIAVYADLPRNTSIPNGILRSFGSHDKESWWSEGYRPFVLVRSPEDIPEVTALLSDKLKARYWPNTPPPPFDIARLNRLNDRYFDGLNPDYRKGNRATVYSLIAVAVLIVLVAMINFINFSMALVPRRIRSINTRKVLGGKTAALRWEQVAEALCITLFSFLLAVWLTGLIASSPLAGMLEADLRPGHNRDMTGITLAIACLSGILASVYPALYSTSFPPALVLKGSFALSASGRRLRTTLIGFQYVVSIALIILALFVRTQYRYMRHYDIGMNSANIVATRLSERMLSQQNALSDKLRQGPGIVDVAYARSEVISADDHLWGMKYQDKHVVVTFQPVTSNFLSVMDIPLTQGRDFRSDDQLRKGAYIVNETARRQYDLEIGKSMGQGGSSQGEIIGTARDFHFKPLHYPIEPIAFFVAKQGDFNDLTYTYIKISAADPFPTLDYIRKTMLEFDPEAASTLKVEFLNESSGGFYQKEHNLASQITLFSLLAVLISTVGAFGLILFETQYRRREIGLRKVFGATVSDILTMFNRRYVRIVAICFLIAAPIAYYSAVHWQNNFLYKAPLNGWIFLISLLLVGLVTVITVTLQSYRTATENPGHSIKNE